MSTHAANVFVTRCGERIELDPDHRAGVRLPSQTGYGCEVSAGDEQAAILGYLGAVGRRVALAVRTLALFGGDVAGKDVLIVGASDGAEAAWLSGLGAESVTGTDHGDVFLDVADGLGDARRGRVMRTARDHAQRLGLGSDWEPEQVRFVIDDICESSLPDDSFDLIVSWQTIEHVPDVPAAMRESARLLRPGGFAYHEYNPFFAIDGGHAAATLDMPWGHVRLDDRDFERYVREHRAGEAEAALRFFRTAINRASHADVRAAVVDAGLDMCAWVPRTRTEDLLLLTPAILGRCVGNHPSVEVADLVSRIVRFAARLAGQRSATSPAIASAVACAGERSPVARKSTAAS